MSSSRRRQTFWLDQAEFMGGAEYFSLDFFAAMTATEIRLLQPTVVGGAHPEYQKRLPESIVTKTLKFPAVSGGLFRQLLAVTKLWWQAKNLRPLIDKESKPQWVTNTPRAHFLMWMAKAFWRTPGRWVAIFHDFTTRPPWLLRLIAKKADILVANSMPTRQYLRDVLYESQYKKIRIIENGVDFGKVPHCDPPESIEKVLHLGRIDPRKGQLHTAEVADLLLERNPELSFTLIGKSVTQDPRTTAYEAEIRDFINKRQLPNIKLPGAVEDPFAQIKAHDALVVLPTEPETFGRIAVEGLACHRLVIAFDQTGPREILSGYHQWLLKKGHLPANTPNPLLIEANNSMTLAETLAYFADKPHEAAIYIQHGREYVEANYHLQETKKRLVELLAS